MTWDALLTIVLNVAIPTLLAVAGGALAIKALPQTKFRERIAWIAVFIFLAVVSLSLAFVQQVRMTSQQAAQEERARNREEYLDGVNKFTEGQLVSIHTVLASLVSSEGGSQQYKSTLVALLAALANRSSQNLQSPSGPPGLAGLTNEELKERTQALVLKLRAFDSDQQAEQDDLLNKQSRDPRNFRDEVAERSSLSDKIQAEFKMQYLDETITLVTELRKESRIHNAPQGIVRTIGTSRDEKTVIALDGSLAGPDPIGDLATYLQTLANMLPTASTKKTESVKSRK